MNPYIYMNHRHNPCFYYLVVGMKSKEIIQKICAMRVFKAANSGLYGVRQNIDTITRAIAIMGLKSVKIITLFKNTMFVKRSTICKRGVCL
jgi:hypothetical protein